MDATSQFSIRQVRDELSAIVDRVEREHERVAVTRHGRPAAMLLSVADVESLDETIQVLASEPLLGQIRESLEQLRDEPASVLSKQEALDLIGRE